MSAHTPGRVEREKREMTEQVGDAESSEGTTGYGRRDGVAVGWDALGLGGLGCDRQGGLVSLLDGLGGRLGGLLGVG